MEDVQKGKANREFPIKKVGVKDITYPLQFKLKNGSVQPTVANIAMFVSLPRHFKGTHMSRFVEILNNHHTDDHWLKNRKNILEEMKQVLEAKSAYIEISFPFFMQKTAPVSNQVGTMDYKCTFTGYLGNGKQKPYYETTMQVSVPVTAVCPCSKTISERGAHNQRGIITVKVDITKRMIWVEDLVSLTEQAGSCEVYSLLKREDEKFVTEKGFDNPMFVEDMARETAHLLTEKQWTPFTIEVVNHESIHNHSAYAFLTEGTFLV
jgi:GTP cyclohydrolase IB